MKTLVHILGPGASGKSTLSRALIHYGVATGEDGGTGIHEITTIVPATVHGVVGEEKVKYVISQQNGIALAGNYKNGSDSIKSIDALPHVLELCWAKAPTVIVDPVRSSMKFIDWMAAYPEPLAALFVYLDISEATNAQRLLNRRFENNMRRSNGHAVPETELPHKTHENMLAFRDRAKGVWEHVWATYTRSPKLALSLNESLSPVQGAELVYRGVQFLKQAAENPASTLATHSLAENQRDFVRWTSF
jgi:hypothetical protein